jgi:hypothetical protein
MANDPVRERYDAFFAADFMPTIRHQQAQGSPERMAYAAEYCAHRLGVISHQLERLIDVMERNASGNKGDKE